MESLAPTGDAEEGANKANPGPLAGQGILEKNERLAVRSFARRAITTTSQSVKTANAMEDNTPRPVAGVAKRYTTTITAAGINTCGKIIANATLSNGETRAVILTFIH